MTEKQAAGRHGNGRQELTRQTSGKRETRPDWQRSTDSTPEDKDGSWSSAERTSLGISLTIVLGLLALIAFLYLTGEGDGATIEVQPALDQVRHESGNFYLPVTIENIGSSTAESVIVEVTLTSSSGQQETSEATIDFLAENATEDAVAVFSEDPREGEVDVNVKSFLDP